MAKYYSKYYVFKASIKEQNITIKDALKIWILNNLGPISKTYLTIIKNQIQKDENLQEDKILFKAIEEKETHIKVEHKAFANFILTKPNAKPKKKASKEKKEFVKWPKCRKCSCKYLVDQVDKYPNKKCDKCLKKDYISHFHDSYINLNKEMTLKGFVASNLDSKKKMSYVIQVVTNEMFETGITQKIIVDLGITQHLIANCKLICDYYENYSKYQTRSGEILPSYEKNMSLDNGFLKLSNVWYTLDLGFNLISTIQLRKKGVEMWL